MKKTKNSEKNRFKKKKKPEIGHGNRIGLYIKFYRCVVLSAISQLHWYNTHARGFQNFDLSSKTI